MTKSKKEDTHKIYRKSDTGEFTTKEDVKKNPSKTETETVKNPSPKKKEK